jgi:hypothetical protein
MSAPWWSIALVPAGDFFEKHYNSWSGHAATYPLAAAAGILMWATMTIIMAGAPGFFYGPPLLVGCIIGLYLVNHSQQGATPSAHSKHRAGALGLAIAFVSNIIIAAITLPFFWVPKGGSAGRPMAWAFGTFVLSGVCIISVGFLSIYSIRRERRYLWAIIAMALAVVSFFLGGSLMDLAMRLRGFTLEP